MNRTVLIGLAGAAIVLVALLLNDVLNETPVEQAEAPAVPAPTQEEDGAPATTGPQAEGASDSAADAASGEAAPDAVQQALDQAEAVTDQLTGQPTAPAGESAPGADARTDASSDASSEAAPAGEEPDPAIPQFDVVRVAPEGDTVIAGRAPPGAEVTILDNGEPIGTVTADERGEWVYLPSEPLAPGSHELSLRAVPRDGAPRESDSKVVLVVPETGKDVAGRPTSEPQAPLAVLVPTDEEALGARVLQRPSVPGSVESETGDLALDSVDYDEDGNISLGGRGLPESEVRAYLNNDLIGRTGTPPTGLWRITPDAPVAPGAYQLRLDMVGRDGEVVARIELPFSRAEPMRDFMGGGFVVVQPGNSLWRIARRTLDSGFNYTVIYEANKDQIRDPDLIYPGQIFEIPAN